MPNPNSPYLTDHWTTNDHLNFSDFRPALLNILLEADTPVTVGVFGPWGSGKTSLLQMLKQEIDSQGNPRIKTVWFTAWKYDRYEALWRAFILRVIDGLYYKEGDERIPAEKLADKEQRENVEQLDRMIASLYDTVTWEDPGVWTMDWGLTAKEGVKLPASLMLRLAGLGSIAEAYEIDPKFGEIIRKEVQEHRLEHLESMEQFESTFQQALKMILGNEGRLVVFVDDLDRCLPEKSIQVLEAIKLFLHVPQTVFVLGMDREVVERGIETHYKIFSKLEETLRVELPISGDAYLQKLIQIPFQLPPIEMVDVEKYILDLEKPQPGDNRLSEMTRQVFSHGLIPNPRQVKRALNIFHLLKTIAVEREERGGIPRDVIAWPLLAKTVLIQSQWPKVYQLWRNYPTLIQTLEDEYRQRPTSEEELIRGIPISLPNTPSGVVKASAKQTEEEENARSGGLLDKFLTERQDYALLEKMLVFPNEGGEGRERASFIGLSREEIYIYISLAGTIEQQESLGPILDTTLEELLTQFASGDQVLINEAKSKIKTIEPDENGERHRFLGNNLLQMIQDDHEYRPLQRSAAGKGLAALGDPRFDPNRGFLPDEPNLGFIEIPAGSFTMGAGEDQHGVHLPRYFIARYLVTSAQYSKFLNDSNYKVKNSLLHNGLPNHPVVYLSWDEALRYCQWLQGKLIEWLNTNNPIYDLLQNRGWRVLLPSEAEWEKAARVESDTREYPWVGDFDQNKANTIETGLITSTAVGSFPGGESPYGTLDMSGNVWEWTRSLKKDYPYDSNDGREDIEINAARLLCGGSFNDDRFTARCHVSISAQPSKTSRHYGFRIGIVQK